MKFWIFSDLHVDYHRARRATSPVIREPVDYDAVIVAGDVREDTEQSIHWLQRLPLRKPARIFYVQGNHEFWGGDVTQEIEAGHRATRRHGVRNDVTMLYENEVEIDDIMILGTPLWTDFNYFGTQHASMDHVRASFSDFAYIKADGRNWSPEQALSEFTQAQEFLIDGLERAQKKKLKTVVITHHAPDPQSVAARYKDDPYTVCFANKDLIDARLSPDLWVHGHVHNNSDYMIGKTRVVANPHGYDNENLSFNPSLTVEV